MYMNVYVLYTVTVYIILYIMYWLPFLLFCVIFFTIVRWKMDESQAPIGSVEK
jgi:hypothetical protein